MREKQGGLTNLKKTLFEPLKRNHYDFIPKTHKDDRATIQQRQKI